MARFKILLFLLSLALLGAVIGGAWWFYTRVLNHDEVVKKEIKQINGNKNAPPDPGLRRFDMAVDGIAAGNLDEGRDQLYDMLRHFPDSKRAAEAKRIIGEMNMDYLFSPNQNKSRIDHVVQPGESLGLIARKNQTTTEAIMRANGMMNSRLQPGDHLFIFPIDFQIDFSLSKKTLTILRNGRFFKEYLALDAKLGPGIKPQPAGEKTNYEIEIMDRAAWHRGKRVEPTSPYFMDSDKWLTVGKVQTSGKRATSSPLFNFRALKHAEIASESTVTLEPHGAKNTAKISLKSKQSSRTSTTGRRPKKGDVMAGGSVDDEETSDAISAVPDTGIFLKREDIEELFTIIRTRTPVRIVR